MTVTNRIAANELFLQCVEKNSKYEENRQFCKHGWEHLMDVARIAYIINLERGYGLERDLVYAAGLLHDCGRYVELEQETPHEKAGARLAKRILRECDCPETWINQIGQAILEHRKGRATSELGDLLFEADKRSRPCFRCEAEAECNWKSSQKNQKIKY